MCLAKHGVSTPAIITIPPGFVLYSKGSPIKSMMSLCVPVRHTRLPIFSVIDRMSLVLNALRCLCDLQRQGKQVSLN